MQPDSTPRAANAPDQVRVVVCDDDADVAESLAELLRLDGYTVAIAQDGLDGLALMADFRPHCVIADVCMPRLNGEDFVKRVRELHGDDVVLIAMTGFSESVPEVDGAFRRADHYLSKPVDPAVLRRLLPPL